MDILKLYMVITYYVFLPFSVILEGVSTQVVVLGNYFLL